ncbi:hypothetical protein [Sideroxydans sp. CL21]|uniref:hypothetical protein n=1 Tax=Sideroxydans sp. CL21 TaxID=2600596 RepID=UPI0024BC6B47|nr:hypothetical protein [Sideroxydans sp. CL21]
MKFRRESLIKFYDEPKSWTPEIIGRGSHVSAITGLIGEDLIIALLRHYWKAQNIDSNICSYQCNQGKKKGKRLDAWLFSNSTLFQVEVKNWSGHSLSGYNLASNALANELKAFATKRWKHYFEETAGLPLEIAKVLIPMLKPEEYSSKEVKKLICFWAYIVDEEGEPYSVKQLDGDEIHVFSASAYLRSLRDEVIELEMPRAKARLSLLEALFAE